jgi:hypothetical protein
MQSKSLISAQIHIGKKFHTKDLPRKTNSYVESHRLFMSFYTYRKKTYYGINVLFRKGSSHPLSFFQINPKQPPKIFLHESFSYVFHVLSELDKMGEMKLRINAKQKFIFIETLISSSYYLNSILATFEISSQDLLLEIFFDRYIECQKDLSHMNDRPEHWAQSNRLGDIEEFYYETFSGAYLNQITDEFLGKFYEEGPEFQSYDEYFENLQTIFQNKEDFFHKNKNKAIKLLKTNKAEYSKLINLLDELTNAQKVALLIGCQPYSSKGSLIINLYCMLEDETPEYLFSAFHGVFLRWALEHVDGPFKAINHEGRLEITNSRLENFTGRTQLFREVSNFAKFYEDESDEKFIETIISQKESVTAEFKSTIKYSLRAGKDDKDLYYQAVKGICALANTDGGTLLIGYDEDNKTYVGIEKDGFKNTDKWENYLRNHLDSKAGKFIGSMISIQYKKIDGKTLAVVTVPRSSQRIMCKDLHSSTNDSKKFFIRSGAYTKALGIEEAIKYDAQRFG